MKIIFFVLFPLIVFSYSVNGQKHPKGDSINISGSTVEIKIPARNSKNQSEEVKQVQNSLKSELKDYTLEMQNQRFISDNVITEVNVETISVDGIDALKVTYAYTLNYGEMKFQTDDFGPGKYLVKESNALMVTLAVIKKSVEGQLAKYFTPKKEISVNINGSADALPINKAIPYKGEFGDHIVRDCEFDGTSHEMILTISKGIINNQTLAFVRSFAVRDHLKNNIFRQKFSKLKYHHSATVSEQRGGQFRRVYIEMIVYGAFE